MKCSLRRAHRRVARRDGPPAARAPRRPARALALTLALVLSVVCAGAAEAAAPSADEGPTGLSPSAGDAVFALALGYPHAPGRSSLRYPAWDAARLLETLTSLHDPSGRWPGRYLLLADFRSTADRDVFGHLPLRPPTRPGLVRAVEDLNREMDAARADGRRPVLFVFYAGHGDIGAGNMGQVYLRPAGAEPGPGVAEALSGADLRSLVLERSRAERVHLMVDACNAYFLLQGRGPTPSSRRTRRQGRIGRRFAQRLPRVGALLSTSGVARVFESRVLQGGLFSHALRSGLAGAADLDGDRSLSYAELEVYFQETFRGIVNRDLYSPEVYVQAPAADARWEQAWTSARLLELPVEPARGVRLAPGEPQHVYVTDDRGLRVAEIHADGVRPAGLWLPALRESGTLRLVALQQGGAEIPLGVLDATAWGWQAPQVEPEAEALRSRGEAERVAAQLYRHPTGASRLEELDRAHERRLSSLHEIERAQDRYLGLRVAAGAAARGGGALGALGPAPQVQVGIRRERRRWIAGLQLGAQPPAPMEPGSTDSGEVLAWSVGLLGIAGYAIPVGPVLLEPQVALGPGLRLQSGGGAAYALRAAAGAAVLIFLPWQTSWALVLQGQVGPEHLRNLSQPGQPEGAGTDVGLLWTLSLGLDLELPR